MRSVDFEKLLLCKCTNLFISATKLVDVSTNITTPCGRGLGRIKRVLWMGTI
jgi:hypothetical protein